jgi:hypothetical protein
VRALSQSLAKEFGKQNIHVSVSSIAFMFYRLKSQLLGCSCESPCSDAVNFDEHLNALHRVSSTAVSILLAIHQTYRLM